jgi:flagellar hook protein FlgE
MLDSLFVGESGLTTFSRNLSVIGNNVSNMNTPGFKSSQMAFAELVYRNAISDGAAGLRLQLGGGVGAGATRVLFSQGDLRETGRDTDLAVDGNGFFILRAAGETFYTRNGEFQFDDAGFLVSPSSGARVAGLENGVLRDIGIAHLRASPPRATATIRLADNLSTGDTAHDVTVNVFDAAGASHALTLRFTNNSGVTPRSWLFEVRDASNALLSSGEVRFNGDGSPAAGFNTHAFTFSRPGAPSSVMTVDFGTPGTFSGATQFSGGADSSLKLLSQDGFAAGALSSVRFDAEGVLVASYTNGQTRREQQVALAFFAAPEALELEGGSLFVNRAGERPLLGAPGQGVFGALAPGHLESANVDLAQQFSELIVSQRGYQASSQIVSAANEMMQQLLDLRSGRR